MCGSWRASMALLFLWPSLAGTQQPIAVTGAVLASQTAPSSNPNNPALVNRPLQPPASAAADRSRIWLNVVVTDSKGLPVSGLTRQDFTLLDNKQNRPIASFQAYDATAHKPDPPVQVILVLDTVNIDFTQVAYARQELGRFFGENGGHLAQPASIFVLTDNGVDVQQEPTTDGNAEAAQLNQIESQLRSIRRSAGVYGAIDRFEISLRAVSSIAETEGGKPGRKLLIWIGPGWPMLSGLGFQDASPKQQQQLFEMIVDFSTVLRESQITLYSTSGGEPNSYSFYYQSFLKGVQFPRQTQNGDVDVKVLAIQSGGLALGPNNDLKGQIENCVRDASAFYTIAFDPPPADKQNEYHDLKVQVAKPKLTVRTNTGYYNQPPRELQP